MAGSSNPTILPRPCHERCKASRATDGKPPKAFGEALELKVESTAWKAKTPGVRGFREVGGTGLEPVTPSLSNVIALSRRGAGNLSIHRGSRPLVLAAPSGQIPVDWARFLWVWAPGRGLCPKDRGPVVEPRGVRGAAGTPGLAAKPPHGQCRKIGVLPHLGNHAKETARRRPACVRRRQTSRCRDAAAAVLGQAE